MPEAYPLILSFTPLTSLYLQGYGDRTPNTPGPGQIPGRDPLLPRIETLIGGVVDYYYRTMLPQLKPCRINSSDECSWENRVFNPFLDFLCLNRVDITGIYGPFLILEYKTVESGKLEKIVFIDVDEGLLDTGVTRNFEGINGYRELYELWRKYHREIFPLDRYIVMEEIRGKKEDITRNFMVSRIELVRSETGIMIDPSMKSTGTGIVRGMIYGRSSIDYYGALTRYLTRTSKSGDKISPETLKIKIMLLLLVKHPIHKRELRFPTGIGPKRSISIVTGELFEECIDWRMDDEDYCIVTSPMPEELLPDNAWVIHPLTGKYPQTVYARGFAKYEDKDGEEKLVYQKSAPIPAVERGAVFKAEVNNSSVIKYCIPLSLLRGVAELISGEKT